MDGRISGNMILASFSPDCRAFLAPRMLTKTIISGEVICEAGAPMLNLIFPHDGLISLQCVLKDGSYVEKMSFGGDGIAGFEYVLGSTHSKCRSSVIVSGQASWLSVQDFKRATEQFPCIVPALLAYSARKLELVAQAVVCASAHVAVQRISTWLLLAAERSRTGHLDITQQTLSNVFGLRLATVSAACNRLMALGAVHYSRGLLRVVDHNMLEEQACECYETVCLKNHSLQMSELLPVSWMRRAEESDRT